MRRNKITIVTFYGIDGSGKTTLARLLAGIFRREKVNVYTIRLRAHHTLMYLLIRFLFWAKGLNYKLAQGKPAYFNYIVKYYFRDRRLFVALEIASVLTWFIIRVLPKKILCRNHVIFIADRFIPDFIVMLHYTSNLNESTLLKLMKFFERFTLAFSSIVYFHIYVDPHTAILRKKEEQLYPRFVAYLSAMYGWIGRYINHVTVNTTNKNPLESAIQIVNYLKLSKVLKS